MEVSRTKAIHQRLSIRPFRDGLLLVIPPAEDLTRVPGRDAHCSVRPADFPVFMTLHLPTRPADSLASG